jgi:hypothetical protein
VASTSSQQSFSRQAISCLSSFLNSCLTLVAEQEFQSNSPLSSETPSLKMKCFKDQVAHIHGLDAVSKPKKESIIVQLNQAYFETKHNLESSIHFPKCKNEANIGSVTPLVSSSMHGQSKPQPSVGLHSLFVAQSTPCGTSFLPSHFLKFRDRSSLSTNS